VEDLPGVEGGWCRSILSYLEAREGPGLELDAEQAAAAARTCHRVAQAIRAAFAPEGLSVYQANGKAAGQTVFHYHVHLLPRHAGDGMELTWPVKNPPRETLAAYAEKIKAKLA